VSAPEYLDWDDKNLTNQTAEVRTAFVRSGALFDYTAQERRNQFDIWLGKVIEQSHEAEKEPER
jgi:hypothetical protein